MSKRPLTVEEDYENRPANGSKMSRIDFSRNMSCEEALTQLTEQADQLIAALQALKEQQIHIRSEKSANTPTLAETELQRLSRSIAPCFQSLASRPMGFDHSQTFNEPTNALLPAQGSSSAPKRPPLHNSPWQSPGSAAPTQSAITAWTIAEIPSGLPPLPEILDPKLEEQVFTHPGLGLPYSYERLEWLGDAYIELIASSLIFPTFTDLGSGRLSQLREQAVRNVTLAKYFRDYGLSSRAKLSRELERATDLGRGKSSDKDLLKSQADMFEAYVAAVILSDPENGLTKVISWMKTLWGQTLKPQIETLKKKALSTPKALLLPPKDQLRKLIGAKGVKIEYRDLPCNKKDKNMGLPLFAVGVFLTGWGEEGKQLGVGTALAKQEAGHKAATQALENRKLMKEYERKRAVFLEVAASEVSDMEQKAMTGHPG